MGSTVLIYDGQSGSRSTRWGGATGPGRSTHDVGVGPGAAPESWIRSGRRVEGGPGSTPEPGQDLLNISTP